MASTATAPPQSRTKLSKSFQRVITFKKPTNSPSNNRFCLHLPKDKHFIKHLADEAELRNRAAIDAFVTKLFATISSLKAAYAELQSAHCPYDDEGVKCADQVVVDELKAISELKRKFVKKQIDVSSPPHVTLLLSDMLEQQSLTRMYQITVSKMEAQIISKDLEISSLRKLLSKANSLNQSIETRLESNSCFPLFDAIDVSDLTLTNFTTVLHYALRSVQDFVKRLIRDVEAAHWDIDASVKALEPDAVFPKSSYKCFAFESYVNREIFEGFCARSDEDKEDRCKSFEEFKKLKSLPTIHLLKENPRSPLAKFTRAKYMRLVHPKMEFSVSGNLSQRKTLTSWQFPDTDFFGAFAEMARHVWILRCLALSFDEEVSVFRARKGSRFSDVYMESVVAGEIGDEMVVAFTVVPGFKIGKKVVQSQVYLSPAGDGSD